MTSDDLLDRVKDRESFIAFVQALASERRAAEALERENPERYRVDGADGWKNGDIAHYLLAALSYFDPRPLSPPEQTPSWKMFADFLLRKDHRINRPPSG